MKSYFRRFARYNRWANARLYTAVSALDAGAFQAPRSGFFPSICHTLNHLYVADRLWLARFEGCEIPHRRLDEIPHPLFQHLWAARQVEDARIRRVMEDAPESWFGGTLHYTSVANGQAISMPVEQVLAHFFNHQTHHRGQAHAMLSSTEVPPPDLDFAAFMVEAENAS